MLALKHARLGGDFEAIAHVKKEVAIMKALRGSPNILTLRSVAFAGPSNQVLTPAVRRSCNVATCMQAGHSAQKWVSSCGGCAAAPTS